MPTLHAKLVKGVPTCPKCGFKYAGDWVTYGSDEKTGGYWYIFECPNCITKNKRGTVKAKCLVKYYSDKDFNLIQRRSAL